LRQVVVAGTDGLKKDPELENLILLSDELIHLSNELTKKNLTSERLNELKKASDDLVRNCERILGILHSNRYQD
jgi:hypothetical protein